MRRCVAHLFSAGIIHRQKAPDQLFLEQKTDSYPNIDFRNHLGLIGGNWLGPDAKEDTHPKKTFLREVNEELNLRQINSDYRELAMMGFKTSGSYQTTKASARILAKDSRDLEFIKQEIRTSAKPFADFLIHIPGTVYPNNPELGNRIVVGSFWSVPLNDAAWFKLIRLQEKFGNLSIESNSKILTLEEIPRMNYKFMPGIDRILNIFYQGLFIKSNIKERSDIIINPLGLPLEKYSDYLKKLSFKITPQQNRP